MNPAPSDIIVLDTPDTETVTALRGVWESPIGVGYTESQAVRALKEVCERSPECYHCGPVQSIEHYSGERFGTRFEDRPLCEDCKIMLYETDPNAELGKPKRNVERVSVEERKEQHRTLNEFKKYNE